MGYRNETDAKLSRLYCTRKCLFKPELMEKCTHCLFFDRTLVGKVRNKRVKTTTIKTNVNVTIRASNISFTIHPFQQSRDFRLRVKIDIRLIFMHFFFFIILNYFGSIRDNGKLYHKDREKFIQILIDEFDMMIHLPCIDAWIASLSTSIAKRYYLKD